MRAPPRPPFGVSVVDSCLPGSRARLEWLEAKGPKFAELQGPVMENDVTGALLLEELGRDELVRQSRYRQCHA